MTLAQVKIHPPTPPSSPLSRGEGLGMASTGVTGRYQTLGLWGDGGLGLPLRLRTSPNLQQTKCEGWDCHLT